MALIPKDYLDHGVYDQSYVSKDSTIERSSIRGNSSIESESHIIDSNILDHCLITNSRVEKGCHIRSYAKISNSQISDCIITGSTLLENSFIGARTTIMGGSSHFDDLAVVNVRGSARTELHIRGDIKAKSLSVAGVVIIGNDRDTPLVLPDNTTLAHGSIVRSQSDVMVVTVPVTTHDEKTDEDVTQNITLTGSPSTEYGYAASINHNGKIVSIKPDDICTVLLPLFGSHSENRRNLKAVESMFSAMSHE